MDEMSPAMPTQTPGMHYAGFWIRLVAVLVDSIILAIIGRLLFGPQTVDFNGGGINTHGGGRFVLSVVFMVGFWIWQSATPGKMLLGLKIVQEDGSKLTWQKALLRYVGYMLSSVVFCLGFIWIGFDKRKQGWHDKIAKTFVVKK